MPDDDSESFSTVIQPSWSIQIMAREIEPSIFQKHKRLRKAFQNNETCFNQTLKVALRKTKHTRF